MRNINQLEEALERKIAEYGELEDRNADEQQLQAVRGAIGHIHRRMMQELGGETDLPNIPERMLPAADTK